MKDAARLWGAATPEEEERYRKIVQDRASRSPFYELLGMEVVGLAPGEARLRIGTGPQHCDEGGMVHPGVIFALADASSGVAMATLVPRGSRRVVTVEMKANLLAPAREGELIALGRVLREVGDLAVSEAEVCDGAGKLIARSMATFMKMIRT